MVDQVINSSPAPAVADAGAAPAPTAPVNAAPAVASPTSAPSSAISATTADAAPSSPASPPVAPAAPNAETTQPTAAAPASLTPTLDAAPKKTALGEAPKPTEIQKPDAGKPEEAKTGEAQAEAKPAEQAIPTYEPFILPEGITHDQLDQAGMEAFTKELGQFELNSKANHGATQEFANKMMGFHITALQETVQRVHQALQDQLNKRWETWEASCKTDPVYGGNRYETTLGEANQFITTHAGTAAEQAAFRTMLDETGAGDHPAMRAFLSRMHNAFREPTDIAKGQKPQPTTLKPYQKAYGKKG